ncbi:MAG: cytochrome c biogenesis protein CcsA [Nitrosomonas sp.]|nr:cytochrome c biogenesis protein CcsA [Nitrosomonas sp.]MDH5727718.1 cytochrome c biogenesis protein CcsA [Gammaproteobacteria bacterium]
MWLIVTSLFIIVLYIAAASLLWRRLSHDAGISKNKAMLLGLGGLILHFIVLQNNVLTDHGLNLGFTQVGGLAAWFICGLFLLSSARKPTENLGVFIFPLAAIAVIIQILFPTEHFLSTHAESKGLGVHILFSILAYSLLGLAAVQAVLLSIQERHLHNHKPGGFIRALPPMQTMELLLFQMIIVGFSLQTMSLASGFVYLDDMFAQHLVHKTLLSILAWAIFGTLLLGHWLRGWRGRTAVAWTLSGFFTLLIAYFGSKYVLEIILQR